MIIRLGKRRGLEQTEMKRWLDERKGRGDEGKEMQQILLRAFLSQNGQFSLHYLIH